MTLARTPEPGEILADRYRVIRLIGEGGMGTVLEAENTLAHKRVAIKLLHPSLSRNGEAAERLLREAQACCRVRHPNVVEVFDVVHQNDTLFLVMELLEGEVLSALLERGGVPAYDFIQLVLQAMRGVAAVHAAGVIHRDIHPGNILLTREPSNPAPVPKVLDFGIAKIRDQERNLTGSGVTMGTPLYMSYEQLCNARDIDARTDIYPFGVILYQGLTGQQPFEANTLTELLVKLSTEAPRPAKQLAPEIPSALDRLISWALERDRDKRIASMDAFIDELEPFSSARAFRTQMTDAQRTLPAVVPRNRPAPRASRPAPAEVELPPALPTLPEVARPEPVGAAASVPTPPPPAPGRASTILPMAFVAAATLALMGLGTFVVRRCSPPRVAERELAGPPPLPALDAGLAARVPAPAPAGSLAQGALDAAVARSLGDAEALPLATPLAPAREAPAALTPRGRVAPPAPVSKRHFRAGEARPKDF